MVMNISDCSCIFVKDPCSNKSQKGEMGFLCPWVSRTYTAGFSLTRPQFFFSDSFFASGTVEPCSWLVCLLHGCFIKRGNSISLRTYSLQVRFLVLWLNWETKLRNFWHQNIPVVRSVVFSTKLLFFLMSLWTQLIFVFLFLTPKVK